MEGAPETGKAQAHIWGRSMSVLFEDRDKDNEVLRGLIRQHGFRLEEGSER